MGKGDLRLISTTTTLYKLLLPMRPRSIYKPTEVYYYPASLVYRSTSVSYKGHYGRRRRRQISTQTGPKKMDHRIHFDAIDFVTLCNTWQH